MIKSGNRFLRYYLLKAANSVRGCDPSFSATMTSNTMRSIRASINVHSL